MNLNELKLKYINGIYETKAFLIKEKAFTLKSGKESHLYLNHRGFLSHHNYLSLIANIYGLLAEATKTNYQLGVVDSIMSPIIVGAMSHSLKKDFVVVKKTHLTHGTKDIIYGEINGEIILVDDMTSTGGTIIEAANTLRSVGGTVNHAIVSAVRNDTAETNLAKHQIKLWSIASFEEVITELGNSLTQEEKKIIALEHAINY